MISDGVNIGGMTLIKTVPLTPVRLNKNPNFAHLKASQNGGG